MSEQKRFEIIGGKVVAQRDVSAATAFRCTMCKLREQQVADIRKELHDRDKKILSLKEELTRVQNARAEKREAYSSVDLERRTTRESISRMAKSLLMFVRYVRVVLWTLKTLRDHPPGGFCVACEQPDGTHDAHCAIAKLFDEPARVIADHHGIQIDERDLPIPEDLRSSAVEPMIEKPWALYSDLTKDCREPGCTGHPLRGKLFCAQHMPRGY